MRSGHRPDPTKFPFKQDNQYKRTYLGGNREHLRVLPYTRLIRMYFNIENYTLWRDRFLF